MSVGNIRGRLILRLFKAPLTLNTTNLAIACAVIIIKGDQFRDRKGRMTVNDQFSISDEELSDWQQFGSLFVRRKRRKRQRFNFVCSTSSVMIPSTPAADFIAFHQWAHVNLHPLCVCPSSWVKWSSASAGDISLFYFTVDKWCDYDSWYYLTVSVTVVFIAHLNRSRFVCGT